MNTPKQAQRQLTQNIGTLVAQQRHLQGLSIDSLARSFSNQKLQKKQIKQIIQSIERGEAFFTTDKKQKDSVQYVITALTQKLDIGEQTFYFDRELDLIYRQNQYLQPIYFESSFASNMPPDEYDALYDSSDPFDPNDTAIQ